MQVGFISPYKQDDTISFRGTNWLFSVLFFFQHGKLCFLSWLCSWKFDFESFEVFP